MPNQISIFTQKCYPHMNDYPSESHLKSTNSPISPRNNLVNIKRPRSSAKASKPQLHCVGSASSHGKAAPPTCILRPLSLSLLLSASKGCVRPSRACKWPVPRPLSAAASARQPFSALGLFYRLSPRAAARSFVRCRGAQPARARRGRPHGNVYISIEGRKSLQLERKKNARFRYEPRDPPMGPGHFFATISRWPAAAAAGASGFLRVPRLIFSHLYEDWKISRTIIMDYWAVRLRKFLSARYFLINSSRVLRTRFYERAYSEKVPQNNAARARAATRASNGLSNASYSHFTIFYTRLYHRATNIHQRGKPKTHNSRQSRERERERSSAQRRPNIIADKETNNRHQVREKSR